MTPAKTEAPTREQAVAVCDREPAQLAEAAAATDPSDVLIEEDLLIEDVSIDGMCGVY